MLWTVIWDVRTIWDHLEGHLIVSGASELSQKVRTLCRNVIGLVHALGYTDHHESNHQRNRDCTSKRVRKLSKTFAATLEHVIDTSYKQKLKEACLGI